MTANFAKLPNLCYNAEPMTHAVLNVGDWPLTSFTAKPCPVLEQQMG